MASWTVVLFHWLPFGRRLRPSRDVALFGGLVLVALGLRLWDLGVRPFHYDESLHAFYSWQLFTGDGYRHEPWIHGPLQFFLNSFVFVIFRDSDYSARLVYALFGAALVGLPFFLRDYLGRPTAFIASVMLAVSPSLLYFSRYTRNDILMAFWAMALFVLMWRYLHERKDRYLYMTAAVLALAMTTKETSFIIMAVFGGFLFILAITDIVPWLMGRIRLSDLAGPGAFLLLMVTLTLPQWAVFASLFQGSGEEGVVLAYSGNAPGNPVGLPLWADPFINLAPIHLPAALDVLILGGVITAALWAISVSRNRPRVVIAVASVTVVFAMAYAIMAWSNVEVARNYLIAGGVLISATALSIVVGLMWRWKVWVISASIFYLIWVTFYTSLFGTVVRPFTECPDTLPGTVDKICTRFGGAFTGVWQSMGYWVAQQEVARGNQPWYYYFVLGSVYEFLPLILGGMGVIYFLRKGGALGLFLTFWALGNFIVYTVASEKMPWLLVNITLPFILLSATFLGELAGSLPWRRLLRSGALGVLLVAPGFLVSGVYLLKRYLDPGGISSGSDWTVVAVFVVVSLALGAFLTRARAVEGLKLATLGAAVLLLGLTAFVGFRVAYSSNEDTVEMLVYAGASQDVRQLATDLRGEFSSEDPVQVDYEIWYPFNWYVRNDGFVEYRCYKDESEDGYVDWCNTLQETPTSPGLVLIDSHSQRDAQQLLAYEKEGPFKDLLWFPESYRRPGENRQEESIWEEVRKDLAYAKDVVVDKESWREAVDYLIYRKLSSEWWDSRFYIYLQKGS